MLHDRQQVWPFVSERTELLVDEAPAGDVSAAMFGHLDRDVLDLEIQPLNRLPYVFRHCRRAVVLVDHDLAAELPQDVFEAHNIGVSTDWLLNQDVGAWVTGRDRLQGVNVMLGRNTDVPEGWP